MPTETFNSTTTWDCPLGLSSISFVRCIGGGGAGAEQDIGVVGGGGGGGGGYVHKLDFAVSFPNTYDVVIGAGGVAGVDSGNGGDTYFSDGISVKGNGGTGASGVANGAGGSGVGDVVRAGGDAGSSGSLSGGGGGGESGSSIGAGFTGTNGDVSGGGAGGTGGAGGDGGGGGGLTAIGSNGSLVGGGGGGDGYNFAGSGAGIGAHGQLILEYTWPAPVPTSCTPDNGPTAGGTPVTIAGTLFSAGCTVKFGGVSATDVVVVDTMTITCTTPTHNQGSVTVTVSNADGNPGDLADGYAFQGSSTGKGGLSALTGLSGLSSI